MGVSGVCNSTSTAPSSWLASYVWGEGGGGGGGVGKKVVM